MNLSESAILRLDIEFVRVYGLDNVLAALKRIAAHHCDEVANREGDSDLAKAWYQASLDIPRVEGI